MISTTYKIPDNLQILVDELANNKMPWKQRMASATELGCIVMAIVEHMVSFDKEIKKHRKELQEIIELSKMVQE